VDSAGVENCPLPLTKPVAVNTGLTLPRHLETFDISHAFLPLSVAKFSTPKNSLQRALSRVQYDSPRASHCRRQCGSAVATWVTARRVCDDLDSQIMPVFSFCDPIALTR